MSEDTRPGGFAGAPPPESSLGATALPPPPPPSGPPGWPAAQVAYSGVATTSGKAGWSLGLAVIAWFLCPVVGAVAALVLGGLAKNDIAESGGRLTGRTMATAAQVVAVVHLGLVVIAVIVFVIVASVFVGF